MSADIPGLADVIEAAVKSGIAGVHTGVVARVESFDPTRRTATIRPVMRGARVDASGNRTTYLPPAIANVPVAFFQVSGASLTADLSAGDFVLAIPLERSHDEWKGSGGADNTPSDSRRHDLADCIAIPGVTHLLAGTVATDSFATGAVVLKGGDIRLGSSLATDFVALASKVLTELGKIWTAFNAHTHGGVFIGAASTGTPSTSGSAASVAATKVKAE